MQSFIHESFSSSGKNGYLVVFKIFVVEVFHDALNDSASDDSRVSNAMSGAGGPMSVVMPGLIFLRVTGFAFQISRRGFRGRGRAQNTTSRPMPDS